MIALSAPEIVAVVLGGQWTAATPVLRLLALAAALQSLNAVHTPLIRAMGAVYRESWRRAFALALILLAVWLSSRWGLIAVIAAVSAARFVQHLLLTQLALRILAIDAGSLLRRYLPGLWAGGLSGAALWFAAGAVRAAGWPGGAGAGAADRHLGLRRPGRRVFRAGLRAPGFCPLVARAFPVCGNGANGTLGAQGAGAPGPPRIGAPGDSRAMKRLRAGQAPPPAAVRYNDWPAVPAPEPGALVPERPVSVIVPCYRAQRALAITLAGLERQDWPSPAAGGGGGR